MTTITKPVANSLIPVTSKFYNIVSCKYVLFTSNPINPSKISK